jgi:hypothetical protein
MILALPEFEDDSQDIMVMRRMFGPALSDQISVFGAIKSLRLESARPSEGYQRIADNFVVDLGVLNAAIANRVPA